MNIFIFIICNLVYALGALIMLSKMEKADCEYEKTLDIILSLLWPITFLTIVCVITYNYIREVFKK